MALEAESRFFETHRTEWVEHHNGKFALVKSENLEGIFDTHEAAFEAGVERWGNSPFLVKQILPEDPIEQLPALMYGLLNARS